MQCHSGHEHCGGVHGFVRVGQQNAAILFPGRADPGLLEQLARDA